MNEHEHREVAHWAAAYTLGALDHTDRQRFAEHLRECVACARETADAAGVVGLLASVDASEFELPDGDVGDDARPTPSAHPPISPAARSRRVGRRMERGRARSKRRAWITPVVGATSLLIGLSALPLVDAFTAPAAVAVEFDTHPGSPMVAAASLTSEPWGTTIAMDCTYDADDDAPWQYELVVVSQSGAESRVGTWSATQGDMRPVATTNVPIAEIQRLEVREVEGTEALMNAHL